MKTLHEIITEFKNAYVLTRMAFYIRLLASYVFCIITVLHLNFESTQILFAAIPIIIHCITWPFVGLFLTLKSKDQKTREIKNIQLDSILTYMVGLAGFPIFFTALGYSYILICAYSAIGRKYMLNTLALSIFFTSIGFLASGAHLHLFTTPFVSYLTITFGLITLILFWQVGAYRISTAKQSAQRLAKEQKSLDNISDILASISPQSSIESLMGKVVNAIREDVDFDGMVIYVFNKEENILSQQYIYSKFRDVKELKTQQTTEISIDSGNSYLLSCFKNDNTNYQDAIVPTTIKAPEDIQLFSVIPFSSMLSIPIIIGNEKIGVAVFLFRTSSGNLNKTAIGKIENYIYNTSYLINNEMLYQKSTHVSSIIQENNEKLLALSQQVKQYLSPQVSNYILSGEKLITKKVSRKWLTVYCSDIENFTYISEHLAPEELQLLLNSYLDTLTNVAIQYGGTIDKYIGDMITVFFGDPETDGPKEDALKCVRMALAMNTALENLREKWLEQGIVQTFKIRTAITSGILLVGNIGGDVRQDYTAYGNDMTYAMILQTKAEPGSILVTELTYNLIKKEISCTPFETNLINGECSYQHYKVLGEYENMETKDHVLLEKGEHFYLNFLPKELGITDRYNVQEALFITKNAIRFHDSLPRRILEKFKFFMKNSKAT